MLCSRWRKRALDKLAKLFIGKTGIFDHDPKGEKQTARIFDTHIKSFDGRLTSDGKPYLALCASAYMVRTGANADLIKEISGGIKKEVSVSCAVARQICSVCGADRNKSACAHIKGRQYGEKLCYVTLDEPTDAYEWSFVAVPAQVNAGVTKHYDVRREESRTVSKLKGELSQAAKRLAAAYECVRGDVLRLSYFCEPFYSAQQVAKMTEDMDILQLIELRAALEKQVQGTGDDDGESFITRLPDKDDNTDYTV